MRQIFLKLLLVSTLITQARSYVNALPGTGNSNFPPRTIEGVVTDQNGQGLVGASVVIKGTSIGSITDIDGSFTISADDRDTLVISYIGYTTKEVVVGQQTYLSIQLELSSTLLDDVVVVAYGTKKRSDVTGAISSVDVKDFNQGVVVNPGQLLQGKVAGVNVTNSSGEPGANQNIIIRGIGSLRSGTTPLFVVDGFLLDNTSNGLSTNPLNFINPNDIESIDVLKDASAAALYGSRASNGVVVITTKKGQQGKTQINFSANTAWSKLANKMDLFSADEFRQNVKAIGGVLDDQGNNTDWQDVLSQTGMSQDYGLSLSGAASEKFSYYASVGIQKQEGILPNSSLDRYSGKLKMDQSAWNGRIKIAYNLTASYSENLRPNIGSTLADMLDLNPTFAAEKNGQYTFLPEDRINPLLRNDLYSDDANSNRILATISPSVEILKGLVYKANLGIDYALTSRYVQNKAYSEAAYDQLGSLNSISAENTNRLIENTLTYALSSNKHHATVLAGHSYQKFFDFYRNLYQGAFEDTEIDPKYHDHESPEINKTTVDASAQVNELQSFFGRFDYDFDGKYLLTATMRADGSSKFGQDNKYGYFPSFALGWNISREDFFSVAMVDYLKLRASWGQTGNQEIPSKITQESFREVKGQTTGQGSQNTYPLEENQNTLDEYPVGISYTRLANPQIQWEVSTQTDVGFDFSLFNYRLTGTVDYYNKKSDNILLEVTTPDPISPTTTYWTNIPNLEIRNSGVELGLEFASNPVADLRWSIGGNLTTIANKIVNSPYKVLTTGSAQGAGQTGATINGYINDYPVGAFYMLQFDGIGEGGLSKYKDLDGDDQVTDNDREYVGSALPNLSYGFYGNAGYKGFDLSINFNGVSGNKIYNHNHMEFFNRGRLATSNNTTAAAIEFSNESNTNSNTVSTRYLEDGSFLRLNNLTLGYTLTPQELGLGTNTFNNVRIYLTGQNLFTLTKYTGFDPELNTGISIGGIQTFGIDRLTYPTARSILIGLNVNF